MSVMVAYLDQKRERLVKRRERLQKAFEQGAKSESQTRRLGRLYERIHQTKEFLDAINRIEKEQGLATPAGANYYAISSLFLHEWARLPKV
jgi:hypothetical protein